MQGEISRYYVTTVDQLRVEDTRLRVETETSLITPEAHSIDGHLPPDHLSCRSPCPQDLLEAPLGMKDV